MKIEKNYVYPYVTFIMTSIENWVSQCLIALYKTLTRGGNMATLIVSLVTNINPKNLIINDFML